MNDQQVKQKEHCNVATMGHIDHGKTTLTSAITFLLSSVVGSKKVKFKKYADIDNTPEERTRGITINAAHIEYETETRHYAHIDCPGHEDYVKNLITGAARVDVVVLVVSATDGIMPQTSEHLLLASQMRVKDLVVFINKCDMVSKDDEVLTDLIAMEMTEMVKTYKFERFKIIRGSALKVLENDSSWFGPIKELLEYLDNTSLKRDNRDEPFLFCVEDVFSITGRGTVVTGKCARGTCKKNDTVSIVGFDHKCMTATVTGLQVFLKDIDIVIPGDNAGLLLRGINKEDVKRGCVVAAPGTISNYSKIECHFYAIPTEQGGRKNGITPGYSPQMFIGTADISVTFECIDGSDLIMPGDSIKVVLSSKLLIPCSVDDVFIIRDSKITVGGGVITKLLSREHSKDAKSRKHTF